MKIAITGHSAGIGKSFANLLEQRGHDIIGLSKRNGYNIRVIPRIVDNVVDCDMFINNAQAGYSQTELLYQVWRQWQGQREKIIWVISTLMTHAPTNPAITGLDDIAMSEYRTQKVALEEAFWQLKSKVGSPTMCLIRPGNIATSDSKTAGIDSCDVDLWCGAVLNCWDKTTMNQMMLDDISIGFLPRELPKI